MKKTILSLFLVGSSCAMFAQNPAGDTTKWNSIKPDSAKTYRSTDSTMSNMNMGNMNNMNKDSMSRMNNASLSSNNAYNAYGATSVAIPYRAQMNFQKDYPGVANNNITWTQSGDWYHGTYLNNGRYSHIYYNDKGNTYTVSMPVTQTYVPDDIMSKATTMYGPTIYDVTTLKGDSTHANIYQIRTLENGQVKAQWIADDGSTVADPFRSDINTTAAGTGSNTNVNANANSMNNTDKTMMHNADSSSMNHNADSTNHANMKTDWNAPAKHATDSTTTKDSTLNNTPAGTKPATDTSGTNPKKY